MRFFSGENFFNSFFIVETPICAALLLPIRDNEVCCQIIWQIVRYDWTTFNSRINWSNLSQTNFCPQVFTPLPNGDTNAVNEFLEEIEVIFTVIFTGECLMRIVALGFVAHPNAYLRNTWNILDFTIVMIGWVKQLHSVHTFISQMERAHKGTQHD